MNKSLLYTVIFIIISIFLIAFLMTSYRYYQAIHSDDPIDPYLSVEKGEASIIREKTAIDMVTSESYTLREGDIILTRTDSIALVVWPDHSTTRRAPIHGDHRAYASRIWLLKNRTPCRTRKWKGLVQYCSHTLSRFSHRIPSAKSGTVAWVRGTVFEINLDANYIHSVDHSVSLKNILGTSVILMPGEAVRASNIFEKITTGFDAAWISFNQSKDLLYTSVRNTQLRTSYDLLIGKTGITSTWDRWVRSVLSWIPSFWDIEDLAAINTGDLAHLSDNSQKMVLKWYQAFQSKDFVQERDQFRGVIISMKDTFIHWDQILETITRWALWDSMDTSGALLKNTQTLLDTYAKKTGMTLGDLISNLRNIDTDRVTTESRALYEKLFQ